MSTGIEWTTETWNPIAAYDRETGDRGWMCTRVSPGCKHCYAAKMNREAAFMGTGHDFTVPNLEEVRFELAAGGQSGVFAPLRWSKPRRIFVCSMTDIFGPWVDDAWLRLLFSVMATARYHTFQVLTKRPERAAEFLSGLDWRAGIMPIRPKDGPKQLLHTFCAKDEDVEGGMRIEEARPGWVPPNVWIGTSVEDQERADERIPHLVETPAAVRFLSCEPLLGPVDLRLHRVDGIAVDDLCGDCGERHEGRCAPGLDWVIVGGESGPDARPMDPDWVREIVRQCRAADVAPFVKQLGSVWAGSPGKKGGAMDGWPTDLRVREFPDEVQVPA